LKRLYIDWEVSKKIENELNEIHFCDVPIGGLFSFYLSSITDQGIINDNLIEHLKTKLLSLKYRYFNDKEVKANFNGDENKGKILFGITDNSSRFIALIDPLVSGIGFENCIVTGRQDKFYLPIDKPIYKFREGLSKEEYKQWETEYNLKNPSLKLKLEKLEKELSLPRIVALNLKFWFIIQTQKLISLEKLIDTLSPKKLIVDHDRQFHNSILIGICKAKNIPTYTLIHGLTLPPTFSFPILTDYLLAWGDYHKSQFSALGFPKVHIFVCGNYKLDQTITITRKNYKGDLFNNKSKRIVLFASTNIEPAQKMILAKEFCEATKVIKDEAYFVFRLHPSEQKEEFQNLIQDFPHILFLHSNELSYQEALELPDIIVGHNTAFLIEAFLKNKQIVVFDSSSITYPIGVSLLIHEKGYKLRATNKEELHSMIVSELENNLPENKTDWLCSDFGQIAVHNYCQSILN
jgi:hypothetical protein